MPVSIGNALPKATNLNEYEPDVVSGTPIVVAAIHSITFQEGIPPNFDELPEEEQERIRQVYRFQGMRLRSDVRNNTIPLLREEMSVP
jgi:hypothetical protein